jgi:hypothetical protein
MGIKCDVFLRLVAAAFLLAGAAYSQDGPSLGDLARQQRQQKEQAAAAVQDKKVSASRVITNEEIPEQTGDLPSAADDKGNSGRSAPGTWKRTKQSPEFWKSRIQAQKGQIASLQRRIEEINGSIRFSSYDCGANCVIRNERQINKQRQVEQMQGQLELQSKRLQEMQETARKQGYGSSVYEP